MFSHSFGHAARLTGNDRFLKKGGFDDQVTTVSEVLVRDKERIGYPDKRVVDALIGNPAKMQ